MASSAPRPRTGGEEEEGWLRNSVTSVSSWVSSLGDTTGLSTLLPWLQAFESDEDAEADEDDGRRKSHRRTRTFDLSEDPADLRSNSTTNSSTKNRSGVRSWIPSRRSTKQSRRNARSIRSSATSRGLHESVVGSPRIQRASTNSISMNSQPRYSIHGSGGGEHIRAPTWYRANVSDGMLKMRRNGRRSKKFKERHCVVS